jgi:hypothetical protein
MSVACSKAEQARFSIRIPPDERKESRTKRPVAEDETDEHRAVTLDPSHCRRSRAQRRAQSVQPTEMKHSGHIYSITNALDPVRAGLLRALMDLLRGQPRRLPDHGCVVEYADAIYAEMNLTHVLVSSNSECRIVI